MDWLIRALWNIRWRGKVRFLSPLVPRTGSRYSTVFGTRINLDLSDYVQRMMYLGCFEREETTRVLRHLRRGMTFLDAGANAGYFTYLAASRVGRSGRVVSVEPDPVLFSKLAGAVCENRLSAVTALNVGLGRVVGESSLFIPRAEHANRAPTMTPVSGWEEVRVPIRTLDDVLDELDVSGVDLLKIDVEGFEGEVLSGSTRALAAGRIRAVLCEFNDFWLRENGTSPERVWQSLIGYGFRAASTKPAFVPGSVLNGFFVRG